MGGGRERKWAAGLYFDCLEQSKLLPWKAVEGERGHHIDLACNSWTGVKQDTI